MIIPHQDLNPSTLRTIVEEFVSREGTDYGNVTFSLEQKVDHVLKQLQRGEVLVVFDPTSETCNIVSKLSSQFQTPTPSSDPQ